MDGCGCHKATSFQKEPAANKPQGFLNQGPDWQPIGCKSHTKKATNWKFCYAFIGNFCSFLARWQDFIVVAMPRTGYWSFWRKDGRGSSLSLWVVLNNKLQRKRICVKREKEKNERRDCFSLLEPFKSELTIMSNMISTNGSDSCDSQILANLIGTL